MRARLIESALIVFTMKGVEAAVIDDVIDLAEVSRGTYYNYFKTNDELMAAVLQEVSNELLSLVDGAIASRTDPAERVACGIRMVLHAVRKCPLLGRFAALRSCARLLRSKHLARLRVRVARRPRTPGT